VAAIPASIILDYRLSSWSQAALSSRPKLGEKIDSTGGTIDLGP
jgi:hypothetical protein